MNNNILKNIMKIKEAEGKLLAILIDPEKFVPHRASAFLKAIPKETTHIFVGGSAKSALGIEKTVQSIKELSSLPIILFPGDYSQLTPQADGVLFLSLLSGRNPEYLIDQQIKGAEVLKTMPMEVIPTAYILIDGGNISSVAKVTGTTPMNQTDIPAIVHTALAGQYMGAKMIYLEAGSGASFPVSSKIISEVKKHLSIPIIVGGGIRSEQQKSDAYHAGADMVVMGTVFEK